MWFACVRVCVCGYVSAYHMGLFVCVFMCVVEYVQIICLCVCVCVCVCVCMLLLVFFCRYVSLSITRFEVAGEILYVGCLWRYKLPALPH